MIIMTSSDDKAVRDQVETWYFSLFSTSGAVVAEPKEEKNTCWLCCNTIANNYIKTPHWNTHFYISI